MAKARLRLGQSHPDRPQPPKNKIPFTGDDNTAWLAWRNQCDACAHRGPGNECLSGGDLVLESGARRALLAIVPGGCSDWRPKP